ncbi:M28 family peptidase [Pendulispora brunnea]|uniref:Carboxypeptidase Q n=1 Tax=Pendulispora brunnea TaxID=2905690 RepID=A0ABZ2KI93_9BACT
MRSLAASLSFALLASCTHSSATPPTPLATQGGEGVRSSLDERIARLRDDALASHTAVNFIRDLTRDVGARPAGSPNDAKAVAWAEKRLVAEGFASVHREIVTVKHWERGPAAGAILAAKGRKLPLELLALGGSAATPAGGLDAEVVRASSLAEAEALGPNALAGKVLFLDVPTARERDGSGYGRSWSSRVLGSQVAADRGAAALIVRSLATDPSHPHTGNTHSRTLPSVAVSGTSADLLRDTLKQDPKAKVHLEVAARTLPDAESANVVGEIRGHERPDEVVLLAAHLDSWDVGEGATDDAAGCAIVTQAARLLAKYAPRRTVRVVLFAAEEIGVMGGTAYARTHANEVEHIVLAMEADAGEGRALGFRARVPPARAVPIARIASFLAPLGVEAWPGDPDEVGADIQPLHEKGVPVIRVHQDMNAYFDVHHAKSDVFAHIDPASLPQVVAAYAITAYAAAELDAPPRR